VFASFGSDALGRRRNKNVGGTATEYLQDGLKQIRLGPLPESIKPERLGTEKSS
jgi:hypothetical protein